MVGGGTGPTAMDRGLVWRVLHGSSAASAATGLAMLCHLASVMLAARLVEKQVFGIYLVALAAAHAAKTLVGLGLEITLTKQLAAAEANDRQAVLGHVVSIRAVALLMGCLILAIAGGGMAWVDADLPAQLGYVIAIAVLGSLRELLLATLQGVFAFGHLAWGIFLPATLRLGGIGFLYAVASVHLVDLLRLEVLVLAVSLLALLFMLPVRRLMRGWMFDFGSTRDLLAASAPLYANSLLHMLSVRLNLFLLAGFSNTTSVADYGAASQIPDGYARICGALAGAYFPFAARLSRYGVRGNAKRLTQFAVAVLAFGGMFLLVIAALFGSDILTTLLGTKYQSAATTFALLMAAYGVQSLSNVMGYALVADDHSGVTARISLVGLGILLVAGVVAIPILGAVGAAMALVLTSLVVLFLNWRALRDRSQHAVGLGFVVPLAMAAVAVGVGCALVPESVGGRVAILISYVLACGAVVPELRASIAFLFVESGRRLRSLSVGR